MEQDDHPGKTLLDELEGLDIVTAKEFDEIAEKVADYDDSDRVIMLAREFREIHRSYIAMLDHLAAEKARADAAEALAKEEGEARDHWFDLATYEVGGVPQHWKDRAEKAEATVSTLTAESDAPIRERDELKAAHSDTLNTEEQWIARAEKAERERDEAREALKPFAELPDALGGRYFIQLLVYPDGEEPKNGDRHYGPAIRRARSALSGAKDEREG